MATVLSRALKLPGRGLDLQRAKRWWEMQSGQDEDDIPGVCRAGCFRLGFLSPREHPGPIWRIDPPTSSPRISGSQQVPFISDHDREKER